MGLASQAHVRERGICMEITPAVNQNNSLRFHLITDTHHYASCFEDDLSKIHRDQKCLAETGAIIDSAFRLISDDSDCEILLIAGDVTNNGEMESHLEFIEKLRQLKECGKRIYLITATHDYCDEPYPCYKNSEKRGSPTRREELFELYREFGMDEAVSVDPLSRSYCVKLAPGYRLLCLNDDGNGRTFCGYFPPTLEWISEQVKAANAMGDYIFAMTHHPVLPPTPVYPMMSKRDMLGNYKETAGALSDMGLEFIFTGHTHMQNIALKEMRSGRKFYDINTGSLVGYPSAIRKVELNDSAMDITTLQIKSFEWDMEGKTVNEYTKDRFSFLLRSIFDSMAYDIDNLANLASGFSVEKETIYKLRVPIKIGGIIMQHLTLGAMGMLLLCPHKVDKTIKKVKIKDLVIEIISNLYYGDEPYNPNTTVYRAIDAFTNRISKAMKPVRGSKKIDKIFKTIKNGVLYDAPPSDWVALLPRQAGIQKLDLR